ncbi:MAG: TetR/AcrR family transcriptional regulator [Acidimicrobiales bacterium]
MTDLAIGSRGRILDAALALMSERGVAATSMRRLAAESGLNVATLYHYFPSKADLLGAVIAERGYFDRLGREGPPEAVRTGGSPAERWARLLRWLWRAAEGEEVVWRLLIGESLRGDAAARETSVRLADGIDEAIAAWIRDITPELAGDADRLARLSRVLLFSLVVEHLALGPDIDRADARIDDLVEAVAPANLGSVSTPERR